MQKIENIYYQKIGELELENFYCDVIVAVNDKGELISEAPTLSLRLC